MNEQSIEKLLRKAPSVKTPARLLEQLQADIELAQTAGTNHKSRVTNRVSFHRWLPALGFALWLLGCIVVFGIQASRIAELKRTNESLRISAVVEQASAADKARMQLLAAELDQLRKDADDVQRLRMEAEQLRAQVAELATLQEQNRQWRAELKAQAAPLRKPEEDFFAPAANPANRTRCVNNLKQVGLAARMWANDHGNVLPADFDTMKKELNTAKITFCPADQNARYEIMSPGASELQPYVVYSRCTIHNIVGLCDGSVQQLSTPRIVVQKDGQWIIGSTSE